LAKEGRETAYVIVTNGKEPDGVAASLPIFRTRPNATGEWT
jgi:hypothetical protein